VFCRLQAKSHYGSTEDAMVAQTPFHATLPHGLEDGSFKNHSSHGHGHSHSHDSAISSKKICQLKS
jgi:hypothetical protein